MDFKLNDDAPEIKAFRDHVRAWFADNMRGSENMKWSALWSTRQNEAEYDFRRALAGRIGKEGWLFPMFPKEYGGGGLTLAHHMVIEEEIGARGIDLGAVYYTLARLVAPGILRWGTEEQRKAFLPAMMAGEVAVWQLLSEPHGGSDVANVKTKAIRDGDHYVVTGQKAMVGHHHAPDFLWVLVCTDPQGPRHKNLAWIYVPADLPGITRQQMHLSMGIKNMVFFDEVRVPAFNLIGGENNGWRVANTYLEMEHGGDGSVFKNPLFDHLIEHCKETKIAGDALLDDQDTRDLIADILIDTDTVRLFALRNFWHRYVREPHSYGGAQYIYHQRMMRLRTTERLQQILGFDALLCNYDVDEEADFEFAVRSGPGGLHGGGTLDTDRITIARRLGLGRPAESAPTTF